MPNHNLQEFGISAKTHDDPDALAGKWSKQRADDFDSAVAPFGEIEPALGKAEPKTL